MVQTTETILSDEVLADGWRNQLSGVFRSRTMENLREFFKTELNSHQKIFPPPTEVFRALQWVDYPDVRVVILGQDPYHGDGQANGLAFAVHDGIAAPPSLKNIFKEIASDLGCHQPLGTSLEGWAQQGVLLLNTVLTVRAHEAFSHRGKGWEEFTTQIVQVLNARAQPMVFLLWGAPAQKFEALITNKNHLILKAAHPSPLSAYRGFLGCRHFSMANEFLKNVSKPIDWCQTNRF